MESLIVVSTLLPDHSYHIYSRGNNRELIFFNEGNYEYFLMKYYKYMDGYWHTLAWALMGNHFHLAIKVKSTEEILNKASKDFKRVDVGFLSKHKEIIENHRSYRSTDLPSFENLAGLTALQPHLLAWAVSERYRRFLMGYAKAINKQQARTGSLFQKTTRRKHLESEADFTGTICYIHHNPIHHDLAVTYDQYQWSSYLSYLDPNIVYSRPVSDLFESVEHFVHVHKEYQEYKKANSYCVENERL